MKPLIKKLKKINTSKIATSQKNKQSAELDDVSVGNLSKELSNSDKLLKKEVSEKAKKSDEKTCAKNDTATKNGSDFKASTKAEKSSEAMPKTTTSQKVTDSISKTNQIDSTQQVVSENSKVMHSTEKVNQENSESISKKRGTNSRLEKSLQGIMEEEDTHFQSKYFD